MAVPRLSTASTAAVPIHTVPSRSTCTAVMSFDGKPSLVEYNRPRLFEKRVNPSGEPNHIVPSGDSAIDVTAFDARPFFTVYVSSTSSRTRLTPPLSVPAH